jgi:DNA ligase-1
LRGLNGPYEGVEFRCGTGFDAADRERLWRDPKRGTTVIGRVAKIKHFTVGAKDKPRFPVWLGWRHEDDR